MSLNTTPRTWVAGEVVTAAYLNTEIRDAMVGLQAVWTAYTPVWTAATTNPTIGNGTLVGATARIGKTIWQRKAIRMGSTTTYGVGNYTFNYPVAPAAGFGNNENTGMGTAFDTSAGLLPPIAMNRFGTLWFGSAVGGQTLAPAIPFTWASGDVLSALTSYEAA